MAAFWRVGLVMGVPSDRLGALRRSDSERVLVDVASAGVGFVGGVVDDDGVVVRVDLVDGDELGPAAHGDLDEFAVDLDHLCGAVELDLGDDLSEGVDRSGEALAHDEAVGEGRGVAEDEAVEVVDVVDVGDLGVVAFESPALECAGVGGVDEVEAAGESVVVGQRA